MDAIASPAAGSDRDHMAALEKGLAVIECFDQAHDKLTIAEVARATELSRAAARRCLLTLQKLGYAEFDGKFFRLAPRVLRLGYAYLASTALPQLLQPFLERLSEETHESCSASILDGSDIVYIARSAQRRIMSVGLSVGTRLPAHCTSMGRVLLAALERDEAERRIAAAGPRALTPRTLTRGADILAAIERTGRDGFCVVDQELEIGLISIAVPVVSTGGRVVAAINVSGQAQRMDAAGMVSRFLPPMQEAQFALQPLIK